MKLKARTAAILTVVISVVLSFLMFYTLYRVDNKYTASGSQPISGILFVSREELDSEPLRFLICDWEVYRGKLLTPSDFLTEPLPQPDLYASIGEYSAMNFGSETLDVHGSATYRLTLVLPQKQADYTLELPEIFSAYRIYVGGSELYALGETGSDDYSPQIQSRTVSFRAGGVTELLIAVTDYSYIYSGIVYPPALGKPYAVNAMLAEKLLISCSSLGLALVFGVFYLAQGLYIKHKNALFFSLMCFCFIGYSGYPVIHTMFAVQTTILYFTERACGYLMLLLVVLLLNKICGVKRLTVLISEIASSAIVVFCSVVPFYTDTAARYSAFSVMVDMGKWLLCGYLLFISFYSAVLGRSRSLPFLAGTCCFASALAADRIFPVFEPITSGWFTEVAGFAMMLALSVVLWQENMNVYRAKLSLENENRQAEREIEMQKRHYEALAEQIEGVRRVRHDLRHHAVLIESMINDKHFDELSEYVTTLSGDSSLNESMQLCSSYKLDVLLRYYLSVAKNSDIDMKLTVALPESLYISDADLTVVFGNILENAVEACRRCSSDGLFITLTVRCMGANLLIQLDNSFNGEFRSENGYFYSAKEKDRTGIGLSSVKSIAKRCGGSAEFVPLSDSVFRSTVRLVNTDRSNYERND